MATATDPKELLTMSEVRDVLRVSTATLYERVLPTLPTVKLGARRFVRRGALEAWLREQEQAGVHHEAGAEEGAAR